MCQAMRELIEDGRIEGRAEGRATALLVASRIFKALREDGTLSVTEIAGRCECTVEEVEAVRAAFEI